jgi:hypothetical protein
MRENAESVSLGRFHAPTLLRAFRVSIVEFRALNISALEEASLSREKLATNFQHKKLGAKGIRIALGSARAYGHSNRRVVRRRD